LDGYPMSTIVAHDARVNSRTQKTKKSKSQKRRKPGDYTRRGRWLDHVVDNANVLGLSRGAVALATAISRWGGATLKEVWGDQNKFAELALCSPSQFRANMKELENARLMEVDRCEPERGPDGRWFRRLTNRYRFLVPARPKKPRSDQPRNIGAEEQKTTFLDIQLEQVRFIESLIIDEPDKAPPVRPGNIAAMRKYLAMGATKAAETGLVLA
jgi:hypothetical protein